MARAQTRARAGVPPRRLSLHPLLEVLTIRDLGSACVLFWKENAPGMAGMVAFFGFLSLIPLALLILAVFGNLLGGVVTSREVRNLFHGVMPGLSQRQFLITYWDPVRHSRVATTILGVVSLLFGTLGLHDSIDWAINRIWKSPISRPFWVAKLRGLGVIVWVTVFVLVSVGLTWIWAGLLDVAHAPSPVVAGVTALLPSFVIDCAIFTALYKLTPMVPVRTDIALVGAIVGAGLWEVSKIVFGWWVLQEGTYNRVYGPLAATVIVMLWLWISAMIFLLGASIAATVQRRRSDSGQPSRLLDSFHRAGIRF